MNTLVKVMTFDKARKIVLLGGGTAALAYALWPPLEFEYFGIAAALLGVEGLARGYAVAAAMNGSGNGKKA